MGTPFIKLTYQGNNRPLAIKVREPKIPTPVLAVIDNTQPDDKTEVTHIWIGDGVIKVVESFSTVIARMEVELGEPLLPQSSEASAFLHQVDLSSQKRLK